MATILDDQPGVLDPVRTYPAGGFHEELRSANANPFPAGCTAKSVLLIGNKRTELPAEQQPAITRSVDGLMLVLSYTSAQMKAIGTGHDEFWLELSALVNDDDEPFAIQKITFSVLGRAVDSELQPLFVNVNGTQLAITTPPPGYNNNGMTMVAFVLSNKTNGYILNHNKDTLVLGVEAYLPDNLTPDASVSVAPAKINNLPDRNNARLIYPQDGTSFSGTLYLLCYYAPAS